MRSLLALVLLLGAAGLVLGYRVIVLEQRLDALDAQLGTRERPTPAGEAGSGGHAQAPATTPLAPRISQLERDIVGLRADVRSLEAATETTLNEPPADPKQILSVVGSEVSRIRDKQLEFQSQQWMKWRRGSLAQFATQYNLNENQRADIDELLTSEIQRWVELLKREDLADKPEQLAADARTALRDTDNAVRGVLNGEQYAKWIDMRANERRTLWPWLPE